LFTVKSRRPNCKTKKSTGVYEPSGERVGQLGGFMNYDNYPDMYADQGYNYDREGLIIG
jgi:hypothetical protein